MRKFWTPERDALLRRLYPDHHLGSLAARIGTTEKAIRSRAKILKLRRKVNIKHPWTERQVSYLKKHYADTDISILIEKTHHDQRSIWNKAKALGLRKSYEWKAENGRMHSQHPKAIATRFKKGQEPANKGKRIEEFMSAEGIASSSRTRFKKGQQPHNARPIGSEVLHADGYVYIKTASGCVPKHRYVWEQANGAVPEGYVVAFRDGNRQNCDLTNLYLLSRADNARRRTSEETPEARKARLAKAQTSRNKSIRRDKLRLHWGMQPLGKLVKRW